MDQSKEQWIAQIRMKQTMLWRYIYAGLGDYARSSIYRELATAGTREEVERLVEAYKSKWGDREHRYRQVIKL